MQPYPPVLTVLRPLHPPTPSHSQVRERTASGTADVDYEVLNILEFNSTRKRMSVVVRDSHGRLLIFCKVCVWGGEGGGGCSSSERCVIWGGLLTFCMMRRGVGGPSVRRKLHSAHIPSHTITHPFTHPAGC